MKCESVLREVRFGGDVAERDNNLENYFVPTTSFSELIEDEADLILGAKGSGKTAMFRMLSTNSFEGEELVDTDVIPAFNMQGNVIFSRLTNSTNTDEPSLRNKWWLYIIALVGNHLMDKYRAVTGSTGLRRVLNERGLHTADPEPIAVWQMVLDQTTQEENQFRSNANFGLDEVLELEFRVLNTLGRRCWVVFDRLDEAFYANRSLERIALRGLLRAHMDITSYNSPIRTKLFLRTDVLDRITQDGGFVNATHVSSHTIRWNMKSLQDLVARRVVESSAFCQVFGINPNEVRTEQGRTKIIDFVLPRSSNGRESTFEKIVKNMTDGSGEYNPRNVLTFLKLAHKMQLAICERDDPDLDLNGPLISGMTTNSAWAQVSRKRLTDTLYAEFNELRPWVEKFKGAPKQYDSLAALGEVLDLPPSSDEFKQVVSDLRYSGFLSELAHNRYAIARLY
jgi:hypothetical protein